MAFRDEVADMLGECREALGHEVTITPRTRGDWDPAKGKRNDYLEADAETVTLLTQPEETRAYGAPGGAKVQATEIVYRVVAADLTLVPKPDDALTDDDGDGLTRKIADVHRINGGQTYVITVRGGPISLD